MSSRCYGKKGAYMAQSKYEFLDRIEALVAPQRVCGLATREQAQAFKDAMRAIIAEANAAIEYADEKAQQQEGGG